MKFKLPLTPLLGWQHSGKASAFASATIFAIAMTCGGSQLHAQTWNNAGGTGNWLDAANWVGGAAPTGIADDAVVGSPSPVTLNGSVNLNSLLVTADGVVNVNPNLNLDFGGTATTTLNNAGTISTGNNTDLQFQNSVINSGAININATTANTDIEIDSAGATLDGGGTITLSGGLAGINGVGGATLTVVDQTIQGQGSVGENTIGIVNQANGLINANVSGEVLNIDANASGASNAGTLQASGGGILQVTGSVVDNTDGQVVAQNGSEVRFGSSSFTGGTFSTAGTGQLTVNGGTNVDFTDTTIDGNLVSLNNSDTGISGTITNLGTMEVQATTANTDIEVQAGGATLTGGGTVRLEGALAGINGLGGAALTIGDQTIEGQGSIGENTIGIINTSSGLIDANVASQVLQIDSSTSDGVENEGVIQASNEGELRINGSVVDNVGGLIEAQADSRVTLNSSTITGGTLNSVGTGEIEVEGGTNVRLEALSNTGTIASLNNSDTEVLGTIDNSGLMEVRATTANTDIEVQVGDATLTGGGTVRLTGANAGINGLGGSTLTVGNQTIEGEGAIGENTISVVNTSDGLIDANVAGSILQIDANTDGVDNDGVIQSSDQGILRFTGTSVNNTADGLIVAQDNSEVRLNSTTITGGRIDTEFSGQMFVEAGTNVRFEDVTNTGGNLASLNNSDTELLGTFNNLGTLEVRATTANTDVEIQAGGATLTGGGTIRLSGTNAGINGVGGGVLDIQSQLIIGEGRIGENTLDILLGSGGTIEADVAGGTLEIDTAGANATTFFTNNGTLRASNGATLDSLQGVISNGTIDTSAGSAFEALTLASNLGSLISGEGIVDVDSGNINVAGTVAPGSTTGTLNFLDDTVFSSTALLATELESASLFDVLDVAGDLTLDGILSVDLLGGFDPFAADTFLIATATDIFGEFANVSNGGLILTEGGEGTFTVNYLGTGIQLSNFTASAVPEPSSVVLLAGIGFGLILRRRRHA